MVLKALSSSLVIFILFIISLKPITTNDEILIQSPKFNEEYKFSKERSVNFKISIHHPPKAYLSISLVAYKKMNIKGYFSMKENPSNEQSIFKCPLYGDNTILIPLLYLSNNDYGFLRVDCNDICHFQLGIDNIDTIALEYNSKLTVLSISAKQKAIFRYYPKEYNTNDNNSGNDLHSIDIVSGIYKDFEIKAYFINGNSRIEINERKAWLNGNSIFFNPNSITNCKECYYEIIVILQQAYSHIIISHASHNKMSKIKLNQPIYGTLTTIHEDCYTFESSQRDKEFLIYVTLYDKSVMVKFPFTRVNHNQTIDQHSSIIFIPDYDVFCLASIEDMTGYTITIIEIEDNKPFITELLNGYQMIRSHPSDTTALYHQSYYDTTISNLYAYIHVIKGSIIAKAIICNDFPNCPVDPHQNNNDLIHPSTITIIGDDIFFSIKNENIYRRFLSSNQNLFMVYCALKIDCEYTIILYSNIDDIFPLLGNKISFINKSSLVKSIQFNINNPSIRELDISLLSRYQTTTMNISSIVLTKDIYKETHSQLSHIILRNDSKLNSQNTLMHYYNIEINSIAQDHFTFILQAIYQVDKEKIINLWHNEDILLTFNKECNRRIIKLPNVFDYTRVKLYHPLLINIKTLNCKLKVKSLSALNSELRSDSFIYFVIDEQKENHSQMIIEAEDFESFEDTCLAYFASMPLLNEPIMHKGYLLLHENVRHQQVVGIYTSEVFYSYFIMNTMTDLLIDIIHESTRIIQLTYTFPNEKSYSQSVYTSRKYVIDQNQLSHNCLSNSSNSVCMITFHISIANKHIMLFGLNVKSTKEHNSPPIFLRSNKMTYDATIGNSIQYYYCHIFNNDYGEVSFTVKKGSGILYARLLNINSRNGYLPQKTKSYTDNYDLQYDPNTKEILFTKENTQKCIKGNHCIMFIGVESLNINYGSVMDYSIALRRNNIDHNRESSPVLIFSNENVNGNLYGVYNQNIFAYYRYNIPYELKDIMYELQCLSCSLYINYSAYLPTYGQYDHKYSNGKNSLNINTPNTLKVITIGIACDYLDEVNYSNFLFRIIPFSQRISLGYQLINSEQPFICNNLASNSPQCIYLIPVYQYEKLHELIVGLYRDDNAAKAFTTIDSNNVVDSDDYSSSFEVMLYSYEDFDTIYNSSSLNFHHSQFMHISKLKEKKKYVSINSSSLESDSFILINLTPKKKSLYYLYIAYPNKVQTSFAPKTKKVILIPKNESKQLSFNKNNKPYVTQIQHIEGKGIITIANEDILFNSEHDEMNIIINSEQHIDIKSIEKELIFFAKYYPKESENILEMKASKWNYALYPNSNAFPIMKYIAVGNEDDEVTFNFMLPLRITYKEKETYSKWNIKGFILNNDFITKRKANQKLKPQFHSMINGHFDNTLSIGVVTFSSKEIKEYTTNSQKLLLIRIDQDSSDTNDYVTVLTKDIAVPSFNGTIPSYHYFYSKIHLSKQVNTYALITNSNSNITLMEIEYASCYGKSQFAYNYDLNDHYHNDTNIIIKESKVEYGKRIIIISLDKNINAIYFHIFPDTIDHSFPDYEDIHFVLKYKTYDEEKHKEMFTFIGNKRKKVEWSSDDTIFNLKFNPIKINNQIDLHKNTIDYYIRFYSRNDFKYIEEISSICLYHNPFRSKHVIKQAKDEEMLRIQLSNFTKGELYCNIIAKFQENNSTIEHIFLYDSFSISSKHGIKRRLKYIWIIIILLMIILLMLLILFYLYRLIRKMQMSHEYKLIDERRKNNQIKAKRFANNEYIKLEMENKISSLIDTS